jgi:hypothetical protein
LGKKNYWPKNTLHWDGGPWHVDDCGLALSAALAAPATANKTTAAKTERTRFMRHLGEFDRDLTGSMDREYRLRKYRKMTV